MKNVMIKNGSGYPMNDIYEYLAGYTTKLFGKVTILREEGKYYDTLVVNKKVETVFHFGAKNVPL